MLVARDCDFPALDQQLSYTDDWTTVHDILARPGGRYRQPAGCGAQGRGFPHHPDPGWRTLHHGRVARQICVEGQLVDPERLPRSWAPTARCSSSPTRLTSRSPMTAPSPRATAPRAGCSIVEFADPQNVERVGENLADWRQCRAGGRHHYPAGLHREIQRLGRRADESDARDPARLRRHRQPPCRSTTNSAAAPSRSSAPSTANLENAT